MRLQFLGATGTVTGSKYLLEHGGRKLLVDCGLFQGVKQARGCTGSGAASTAWTMNSARACAAWPGSSTRSKSRSG